MYRNLLPFFLLGCILLTGCTQTTTQAPAESVGIPSTIEIRGTPLHLTGTLTTQTSINAPVDLAINTTFTDDVPYLFLPNATVNGETGLVALVGPDIRIETGSATFHRLSQVTLDGDRIRLHPAYMEDDPRFSFEFPAGFEDLEHVYTLAEESRVTLDDAELSGYDRGVFINENESLELSDTVTASTDYLSWDGAVTAEAATTSLHIDADSFSAGGSITSSSIEDSELGNPDADAVFGRSGLLDLGQSRIHGEARLTQVLTSDGPVIDSRVRTTTEQRIVDVAFNDTTWVRAHFEETSYRGDAILKDVTVSGEGASMVEVPLKRPSLMIQQLAEMVERQAEIFPPAAIGLLAAPAAIFGDVLRGIGCTLTECPADYPYPVWINAGSSGVFYYRVTGDTQPGTYNTTITFTGENYPDSSIQTTITVHDSQTTN